MKKGMWVSLVAAAVLSLAEGSPVAPEGDRQNIAAAQEAQPVAGEPMAKSEPAFDARSSMQSPEFVPERAAESVPSNIPTRLARMAKSDEWRARFSSLGAAVAGLGGALALSLRDSSPALGEQLGLLAVSVYTAQVFLSQHRYYTQRAAHYHACSLALEARQESGDVNELYEMLRPKDGFDAPPQSPLEAIVKATGKAT